jgi:hypothetical protein
VELHWGCIAFKSMLEVLGRKVYIKRENWRRSTCRTLVEPEVLTQKGKEMQRECAQGVLNRGFPCEAVILR